MKTTGFVPFTIAALLASTSLGQAPKETPPEKATILEIDRAFEAAYAKADVKALASFFTEDAEYTTDDGRTFTGRAAIEESLRGAFPANKGAKLAIQVDTVRALSPEVLLEKGSTTVTGKNGDSDGALYTAIHTKKDGQWKISHLVETPLPVAAPHDRLRELEWLIGTWEESDKTSDLTVHSEFVWARGANFVTRNVTVKRAGETTLEGWQVIGWDPIEERIRSWTFDDAGGFSEGAWSREGDRWLVRESGYAADGSRTTAENTLSKVAADKFTWESNNRTLDGDPQPSIARIETIRVKGN